MSDLEKNVQFPQTTTEEN